MERQAVANSIRIAPSLLAADFARLGEQIHDAESAGADLFHFDVMDGRFVPNITMGPMILQAVRRSTSLPIDVHLMIVEPDHMLEAFAKLEQAASTSIGKPARICIARCKLSKRSAVRRVSPSTRIRLPRSSAKFCPCSTPYWS